MKSLYAAIALMMLSTAAFAQPRPPAGGEGGPPGRPGPREGGPPGGGEFVRSPGPGEGRPDPRMAKFDVLRGYFEVVDRYARLARDPAHAGIAAVVSAADILRPRGADVAIEYFNKLLPEVKTPAVQRAIRLQLADLYKSAGKHEEALEQLKQIMVADTTSEPAPARPPQQ
jgi:hypothetical protein